MAAQDNERAPAASPSWPPITTEPHEWDPPEGLSARQRARLGTHYQAAVTAPIRSATVTIRSELAAVTEDATLALSQFDAEANTVLPAGDLGPLRSILMRSESAASSQIERITVGARQLAQAALGEEASANARLVDASVRAMRAASEMASHVTTTSILRMHSELLHGGSRADPGQFRTCPVWIGNELTRGPQDADFVPPHHSRVPEAMTDLVAFINRDDIPALMHAAIAHAQFETIHPFNDGNGRVGRALIHTMLRRAGVTTRLTVPISAGLLARQSDYISALTAFRNGDIEPMIVESAEAATRATIEGRRLLRDLATIRDRWLSTDPTRHGSTARRLPDLLIEQPVVTVRYVQDRLRVSFPTAQSAIATYERFGALRPAVVGRRRNRVWHAPEITDAMDAFAARSARRQV